jgi:hypothetical protein
MNGWRHWVYPLPADGAVGLLWEVFEQVPTKFGADLDWTLTDKLVVAVSNVTAAVYLRMACGGSRLLGADGLPVLEQNEVLIHIDERDECEAMLRENCRAEAEWYSVVVISARSQAAQQAFDEAYQAVIEQSEVAA